MGLSRTTRFHVTVACCLLILAVILAGCGQSYALAGTPFVPVLDAPEVRGAIRDGEDFVLSSLSEKVKLVFFGYTSCPDICPLTLSNLKSVYGQLTASQRKDVAVVLISVDPQRDTPERLATYTEAFDPAFYGVHIPDDRLAQLLDEYNVFSGKRSVAAEASADAYLLDHTAVIFVVDGNEKLREIFPSNAPADQIVADVRYLLTE